MIKRILNKIRQRFKRLSENKLFSPHRTDILTTRCGNNYGGFDVAKEYADKISTERKLVVYSFGIGEDLSFSEEILKKWPCEIYAFDPTPKSIKYVKSHPLFSNEHFHFYPFGISEKDGSGSFHLPKNENYVSGSLLQHDGVREDTIEVEFKSLKNIMKQLGHEHIDILKMDIEGAEFSVIKNILHDGIEFHQLCVEVHNRMFENGMEMLRETLFLLKKHKYQIISVSDNHEEITFVRSNKKF